MGNFDLIGGWPAVLGNAVDQGVQGVESGMKDRSEAALAAAQANEANARGNYFNRVLGNKLDVAQTAAGAKTDAATIAANAKIVSSQTMADGRVHQTIIATDGNMYDTVIGTDGKIQIAFPTSSSYNPANPTAGVQTPDFGNVGSGMTPRPPFSADPLSVDFNANMGYATNPDGSIIQPGTTPSVNSNAVPMPGAGAPPLQSPGTAVLAQTAPPVSPAGQAPPNPQSFMNFKPVAPSTYTPVAGQAPVPVGALGPEQGTIQAGINDTAHLRAAQIGAQTRLQIADATDDRDFSTKLPQTLASLSMQPPAVQAQLITQLNQVAKKFGIPLNLDPNSPLPKDPATLLQIARTNLTNEQATMLPQMDKFNMDYKNQEMAATIERLGFDKQRAQNIAANSPQFKALTNMYNHDYNALNGPNAVLMSDADTTALANKLQWEQDNLNNLYVGVMGMPNVPGQNVDPNVPAPPGGYAGGGNVPPATFNTMVPSLNQIRPLPVMNFAPPPGRNPPEPRVNTAHIHNLISQGTWFLNH